MEKDGDAAEGVSGESGGGISRSGGIVFPSTRELALLHNDSNSEFRFVAFAKPEMRK